MHREIDFWLEWEDFQLAQPLTMISGLETQKSYLFSYQCSDQWFDNLTICEIGKGKTDLEPTTAEYLGGSMCTNKVLFLSFLSFQPPKCWSFDDLEIFWKSFK